MLQKQAIIFFSLRTEIQEYYPKKLTNLIICSGLCQQHYLGTKNNLFVRIVSSYQQITPNNSFSFVFHLKFVSSFN